MHNATSTVAGFAAAADASRLHVGRGLAAYPWHIGGTRAGRVAAQNNTMITDSKFHLRWPQESSP